MDDAIPNKQTAKRSVAPFNADHGVNPGWGIYEERPVIPAFNGVAEVTRLALLFTLWSRVENFLYEELGIEPLASAKEEKKNRSILLESETYIIALLCLLSNEHYSAGGLVDAMVGVDATADQRGNARKRILNRTLPIVGDRYKLIDYSERHKGNSMEYSICRSERLVEFAEAHLLPAINGIIGSVTQTDAKAGSSSAGKVAAKMKATGEAKATGKVPAKAKAKPKPKAKTSSKSGSKVSAKASTKTAAKAKSKIGPASKKNSTKETAQSGGDA